MRNYLTGKNDAFGFRFFDDMISDFFAPTNFGITKLQWKPT